MTYMETIRLDNDIYVFYITAKSFPDGIMDAYRQLHALIPFSKDRKYFGISRPENGKIVYKAAAEELHEGEGKKLNSDTLTLKKGNYICLTIHDYMKDLEGIGRTFQEMLSHPDLDPDGYCVEWYLNEKDVQCMIRLKDR